ncbi:MAG: hypothetical protein GTO62_17445, partial [Planctomycetales bacterium]|nr:hypothetical protein [Planctomycetales bacterium]NIP71022.1 hypothetical protein [Planctomycetales bacterium]
LGGLLLAYPTLLRCLTWATYWLEWLGPCLAFCPWKTPRLRVALVATFWLFHLGLGMTLALGLFPWIALVAWLPFLPATAWQGLSNWAVGQRVGRATMEFAGWWRAGVERRGWFTRAEVPRGQPRRLTSAVVLFLLLYVIAWNIRETNFAYWQRFMPASWNVVGRVTNLDQHWGLFAPHPLTDDGWFVIKGTLADGSQVNLWDCGAPLPFDKPAQVAATMHGQRWRAYLIRIWNRNEHAHRPHFARWLSQRWNREMAGGDPHKRVTQVDIIYQLENTPPPGQPLPRPESIALWTHTFD